MIGASSRWRCLAPGQHLSAARSMPSRPYGASGRQKPQPRGSCIRDGEAIFKESPASLSGVDMRCRVEKVARQYNLINSARLPKVRGLERAKYLTMKVIKQHAWNPYHWKHLADSESPVLDAIIDKAVAQTNVPLWSFFRVSDSHITKSVVRKKAATKLRAAFREALGKVGYDGGGRKLLHTAESTTPQLLAAKSPEQTAFPRLYGTVRVDFESLAVTNKPYLEIVEDFVHIIRRHVEPVLGQPEP